jgi:hypothetical protein
MLLLVLAGWMALLPGCGGLLAFSGGSVPIGKTRVFGTVVRSDNPLQAVSNARVTLVSSAIGSEPQSFQTLSAPDGRFDFPAIPLGAPTGNIQVTVDPQDASLHPQQVHFLAADKRNANLIVALAPTSFDLSTVSAVAVTPNKVTIRTDVTTQLTATIRDKDNNPLPLVPTLLFDGNVGTISSDGTFYSTGLGSGTVIALWYNDLRSDVATITVDNTLPENPAPPPPPKFPIHEPK